MSPARAARAARVAVAAVLVLLSAGCLRFRGELVIAGDATVSGTVIAAAKGTTALPPGALGTPAPDRGPAAPIRTEPYAENGYLGTRIVLARATFAQVERFFAEQGGGLVPSLPGLPELPGSASPSVPGAGALVARLGMRRDGDDVVVDGRFLFPDFSVGSGADRGAFEARLAITFPGEVLAASGTRDGRTVTWTFRPGDPQDVTARARLAGGGVSWLARAAWAAAALLAVGVGLAVLLLARRRRPPPAVPGHEPGPAPAYGPAPWGPADWSRPGAPVPPGPGLSRPPTYGGT